MLFCYKKEKIVNAYFFFKKKCKFQNYDTSESKLRREFELYGPIKKVNC